MKRTSTFVIAFLLLAVILGAIFGLLITSNHPPDQSYYFSAYSVRTLNPVACSSIPQTYSDWLGINIVGNRTGMSFQLVSVYATGLNIRVDLPLNGTAFSEYKVMNSTFETIIAPLPNYFAPGMVLTLELTYTIENYSPTTFTLYDIPITQGTINC